ncbi:leucyl-tRNA synthetase [Mycoplasma haemofelis Ohio2]|uniref:leucine--tRNA ligase n=1 Tax=Mycoplasma haemofelis (strain Ohio2) TaxID=859194 RepID=F6FH13_MYCHI|nr:leucyl-tRNA synthetase [Mycoplasma haemofelis Ohio2]
MASYDPKAIEEKWISAWDDASLFKFKDDLNSKKFYILDMFPYPSGAGLHVGHVKGYLATDIWARFQKMKGCTVLHPMGWDAFGLPAEQYAIQTGNSPIDFTNRNIDNFRKQCKRLMLFYDWDREINTSDPEYYKHTQWIFSQMYKHGLAELKDSLVNWCEELNTVLADEEIIVGDDGKRYSERGNYEVTSKKMKQWILKITEYADELLEDIQLLDWPENIKKIQENWIGKQNKYRFSFKYGDSEYFLDLDSPDSIKNLKAIGIHSFSRLSQELGITNGEGLNIHLSSGDHKIPVRFIENVDFRSEDLLPILDDEYEGTLIRDSIPVTTYKLKDWVFSRQRYWGEPIPVLFDSDGAQELDEELPVILPRNIEYSSKRSGFSPLINCKEWINVERAGKLYTRESSTMPNWAGSSWYFIAYLLKKDDGGYHDLDSPEAKDILRRWLPVDVYVGGQEHAAMHLLYARFWHKFLHKLGIVSTKEPFKALFNQGMVLGSDGTKMSKSKGNYVNIDEMIDLYGADVLRLYEAFSGPTTLSFKWEESGMKAMQKWLGKVFHFFLELEKYSVVEDDGEVNLAENKLISNVESAIPMMKVNLGVSEMMIFLNEIQRLGKYSFKSLRSFLQILSLYAPATAEELWKEFLKGEDFLLNLKWPELNSNLGEVFQEYKVFIKGKFKFLIKAPMNASEEEVKELVNQKGSYSNIQVVTEKKIVLVS